MPGTGVPPALGDLEQLKAQTGPERLWGAAGVCSRGAERCCAPVQADPAAGERHATSPAAGRGSQQPPGFGGNLEKAAVMTEAPSVCNFFS